MTDGGADALTARLARLTPDKMAQLVRGLQDRIDSLRARVEGPVAIVGMACRLPGAADPVALWDLLSRGSVAVSEVPPARWDAAALARDGVPPFGGFLDSIDTFDAPFFRIPPAEAAAMDPQQRLAAEVAWEALETAGYALPERRPRATGVFLGVSTDDYKARFLSGEPAAVDPRMATGTANSVAAGRLSYMFDLTGPSLAVDTACSSSLVAVHLACRSLRSGECELALAGGVGLLIEPELTVAFSKLGMLSLRGRCSTFGAEADGYVRGEGAAMLVLKRLADAERDGDAVLAVIRGSAINQDGRSNGLTAPNGSAQRAVIAAALADAGVAALEIDAVECHGTATPLGDPIEVEALAGIYGTGRDPQHPLLLGSVKANIGHLEAAAGAAGLVKAVLCLRHRAMPPQPVLDALNPRIRWDEVPLSVPQAHTALQPTTSRPARVGVSSFGFSGTNAHVILEEPPAMAAATQRPTDAQHLIVLSARSAETLAVSAERVAKALERGANVADLAHNLVVDRPRYDSRCAAVGSDAASLAQALRGAASQASSPRPGRPRIGFLFTGQGSQWAGMARGLARAEPLFAKTIAACAEVLRPHLDVPLLDLLWPANPADAPRLDQTGYAQPALFVVEYALAQLWQHWGVQPDVMIGHSIGEYAAACIAGVMPLDDALSLVALRGRLMQSLPAGGGMMSVEASEAETRQWLARHPDLDLVAVNGAEAMVVAGPLPVLDALAASLPAGSHRRLRVSHAFHSRAMEPILNRFADAVSRVPLRPAEIPIVSALTGQLATEDMAKPDYWVRQLREPVRFAAAVAAPEAQALDVAVEIGPRAVLLNAMEKPELVRLASLREREESNATILRSLGAAFAAGVDVAWGAFHGDRGGRRAPAPATPFRRERYWTERQAAAPRTPQAPASAPPSIADLVAPAPTAGMKATPDQIRTIVAEAMQLPVQAIRPDVPFVELGADSLILGQVATRIERSFRVKVPRRELFTSLNTAAALQAHVAAQASAATPDAVPVAPRALSASPAPAIIRPATAGVPSPPLDARGRAHIERLAQRLGERIAGSRQSRDTAIRHLADSRASAGYREAIQPLLYPLVGDRADGARIWDVDGNEYLDITMGFGVQLFGHSAPFIADALRAQMERGLQLGPQARLAGEAARRICRLTGVERVAFCNTGTEAVMTALRLARLATGRQRIALFEGSYHGHFDGVLASASGGDGGSQPLSPGTPGGFVQDVLVLDYADADGTIALLERHRDELAAVLVEPIQSRRPGLQPRDFLRNLRGWTERNGVALIFDEVLLGFRIALGGAQAWAGVEADLVTYGKIIGGGLPIGAVAGRRSFMDRLDGGAWAVGSNGPAGPTIFFAGTFNKNPLTMAASVAVLERLEQDGPALQERLNRRTAVLAERLNAVLATRTAAIRVDCAASLFRFIGAPDLFYYHLLARGLYVWEGRTCFLSTRHTDADLDRIVEIVTASVEALLADGILAGRSEATPTNSEESIPLTPGQHGLWLTCQMSEAVSAAYNQSLRLSFEAAPDRLALERALPKLMQRHANLRGRFQPDGRSLRVVSDDHLPLVILDGDVDAAEKALCWQPFDLEHDRLVRAALSQRGGAWRLTLVLPHLITDGWSLAVMAEELAALYRAELTGAATDLPPADSPLRYLDAIGDATRDETLAARWRQRFMPPPRPIDLPTARPRPAVQTYEGGRIARRLGSERVRRLRALCGREGVGLFAAGLAAYATLLGRLGRTNDLAIGVLSAGQAAHAMPRLVGYYANLLPLRVSLDPAGSVSALLSACQRQLDDAMAGRDYPFAALVRALRLPRDPSRPPLVSVGFNADRIDAAPDFGAPVTLEGNIHSAVRWDLFFNMVMDGNEVELQADYATALFDAEQVAAWVDEYIGVLDRFVAGTSPLPSPRRPLLVERILDQAASRPAVTAVEDGAHTLNYGDLLREADRLAMRLQSAGVAPGQVVAADLGRSSMMIVAMLAVWRAGAIFMPLEPSHPLDYRRMLLAEAGAACCLCAPEAPARPADGTRRLDVTLERASEPMESSFVPAPLVPEKTAYLLFTSGSTGKPKGVLVSHAAVAAYTSAVLERIDVPTQIGDAAPWRFAVVSSLAADLGYTCVFGALWTGGTLRILQQDEMRDPAAFAGAMAAAPVDVLKIVPTHLGALLDWPEPAAMLPRRRLVLGGEASHWSLIEKVWRLAPGCRVFNHYGPSETTVGATAVELTPSVRGQSPEGVPLGTALGHARIELRSVDGVTRADEGEILIGGEGVAIGYLDRPDDEAARFIADPAGPAGARLYRTGDRGRLSKDGLLLFLGRIDDEVKIRGHRVAPGAVAAKLREFPGVQDCAVLVDPNARGEPRLVAYVAGPRSLSETELRGWAAAHLPPAMVPDTVLRVDALPRTANGKIDRERLRASLPSPRPAAQEHDDAVAMLLQIWRDVLNAPEAGADDDFFALGGDSIMAIQIAGRARTAGLRFNAQLLFEHPTVRALLAVATRAAAAAGPAAEALPATPSPLSPVQRAFFELQQAKPQHWCLSAVLRLPGRPDAEAIRRALRAVIARHPALRLRFRPGADGLLQHLCEESDLGPTPVIVEDGLERAARQALEDALVADFGSSFDLARGPLLGAALLDRGAHEPPALLVVVHHLVFDAVSWSIFAEDLVAALDPLAPVPTSTAGFDAWCKTLERHARTLDGEATSWREIETQIRPILPRLATAADAGENRERHVVREAIHLPVALTADLKRAAAEAATGAGLHDVVLAALAVALTGRTGGPVVLDIEGHGRETIDPTVEIDRTIGWFTTHFPLALALEPSRDRRRLVEEVHRAWRALPGAGLGYGVLRYLRSSAGLDRDPEVSFNFLGTLDLGGSAEARFERFGSAAERDPDAPRRHLLVVEAFVTESALVIELQYARNVVGQDVILEIRDAMTEWLEQLAAREAPARVDQNLPTDLQLDDEEMRLLSERLGL